MTVTHTSAYPAGDAQEAVAVVGMACRFPGADNVEEFWRNLCDGVESIVPVTAQDLRAAGVDPAGVRDGRHVPMAAALRGIEEFDADFFGFSPRQAELTDPQQRLFLECAWEAFEDAGHDPTGRRHPVGVFAGSSSSAYLMFHLRSMVGELWGSSDLPRLIGTDKDYLATRVAYQLNLTGPAVNVQTACSTSLVSVHMACQSLLNQECDLALAGGVTVRLPMRCGYVYEDGGILSPDGHCRPFDVAAQGTIFGSGAGAVVLKRLADALTDGDRIEAVIRGSAVNNDGSAKAGFTAPSEDGQAEVVTEALAVAGVAADTIRYLETHGTGTPLGDAIEIAALDRAFRARSRAGALPPGTCALGAVKSNVGHLESAAGIAGLIKTILSLRHRQLPPTLHFTRPGPETGLDRTPFYVNTRLAEWRRGETPRRAGVSSFGIGGTNAHVVLEEAPEPRAGAVAGSMATDRPYLLPLSAHDPAALAALAGRYADFLAEDGPGSSTPLADVCWTAGARRRHHRHRLPVVGRSRAELVGRLTELAASPVDAAETVVSTDRPGVVFVFPGQGSQWLGMGRQLLAREPVFRDALAECDRVVGRYTGWSVATELARDEGDRAWLEHTDRIQLALFSVQVGLAALWRSLGVEPEVVIGHSMGEAAAAYVAGVLSLEDAVRVLYHRNRLIKSILGQGRMLVTGLAPEQARDALAGHAERVSVAIVNSPGSTVLSGDPAALAAIAATLQRRGTFHRWVDVAFASHSPQVEPIMDELREALREVTPRPATVPIVSTVTGTEVDGTGMDAGYWARNLREPVLFAEATRTARERGADTFLEISPHPILLPSVEDSLFRLDRPGVALPSLRRELDEQRCVLETLGALYRAGAPISWERVHPRAGRVVRLPGYPWQRRRHWIEPPQRVLPAAGDPPGRAGATAPGHAHPLLGGRVRSALPEAQFESRVSLATTPYLADHRVCGRAVFPGTGYLEMLWQAAAGGQHPRLVSDVVLHELLDLSAGTGHVLQTIRTPGRDGEDGLRVYGLPEGGTGWRLYASATVRSAGTRDDPPRLDPAEVRERCPRELDPGTCYRRLSAAGLEYGPLFSGVKSIRLGDGELLGRVRLPDPLAVEAPAYALHPALLDACLQLVGIGVLSGVDGPDGGDGGDDSGGEYYVYLPTGIETFHLAAPAQDLLTAHVRMRGGTNRETATGDLRLYDETGRLVAEVLGLCLKRVRRSALRATFQDDLSRWFYEMRWQPTRRGEHSPPPAPAPATADARRPRWLILADRGGVGQALAALLEERGEAATLAFAADTYRREAGQPIIHVAPSRAGDFPRLLAEAGGPYRGVVYLWGLDATPTEATTVQSLSGDQALICGGALHLVQALVGGGSAAPPRLWLVTRHAQAVAAPDGPLAAAQATLWGLGRSVSAEHADLRCACIDLDVGGAEDHARILIDEISAPDAEDQLAFRRSRRFAARLVRGTAASGPAGADDAVRLTTPSRGSLDRLALAAADRRPPGPGEVEIRVLATGLNFRDVLNALGRRPGEEPLGWECAGEIAAVGGGVAGFEIGDAVVAVAAGAFATYVTVPAGLAAAKPPRLTLAEAATVPIAFMTADYALHRLAHIAAGDTILIHSAAGGLGQAAAQLALRAGAEVIGTASSEEKRAFLRAMGVPHVLRSRTLDFVPEVAELTGGRGVDIVLNALAGEYIPASLEAMAEGGRFIEVGKTDVWDAGRVARARPDLSYFVLDLDAEMRRESALVGDLLSGLLPRFDDRRLLPLPRRVFPLYQARPAFLLMAQGRHLGKVVVTQAPGLSGAVPGRCRPDATYLVTGGLGALGLRTARWLADRGARHLALLGRSGGSGEPGGSGAAVSELRRDGVQVEVIAADVARPDEVARALAAIRSSLPPLRGVIHAAGVLDDGILLRQDWARFAAVLAPKVQGAWNLHEQTLGEPLDFFVMFSSTASVLGAAGQAAYAAANAFLDTLAHLRRAQGLPGLSVNWGGWSGIGLAARTAASGRADLRGVSLIPPDAGVQALAAAMRQQAPQVAVMPIDWPGYLARFPARAIPPLLAESLREAGRADPADASGGGRPELLRRLETAAPAGRRRVLAAHLADLIRSVLGLGPAAPVDPGTPLKELGLDSLLAIQARNKLGTQVGRTLPATVLFDYPTLDELTGYLACELLGPTPADGTRDAPAPNTSTRTNTGTGTERIAADELESSLAEELAAMQALLERGRS